MDKKTDTEHVLPDDLKIKSQRVIAVLKRTLEKMRILASIDYLVCNEGFVLKGYLPDDKIKAVLHLYGQCRFGIEPIPNLNINFKTGEYSATQIAPLITEMISILQANKDVRDIVYLLTEEVEKDEEKKLFFNEFEEFIEHTSKELLTTAAEESEDLTSLAVAHKENKFNLEQIEELNEELGGKSGVFDYKLSKLEQLEDELYERQKRLCTEFRQKMQRLKYDMEKERNEITTQSKARVKLLEEEVARLTQQYEQLLHNNLTDEKNLRTEKYKMETVLANSIAQYDNDVGELYKQLEKETAEYEKETAEMERLQKLFDEQAIEYEEVMARKKAEEERIFTEKLYTFILNRSARRIQRWWREVLARKRARRKARKGKKGKK